MERCFACNKQIKKMAYSAETRDGQTVYVGSECIKKISVMGIHGYQPPLGGPRLFNTMLDYCNHTEHETKGDKT